MLLALYLSNVGRNIQFWQSLHTVFLAFLWLKHVLYVEKLRKIFIGTAVIVEQQLTLLATIK